MQKIFLTLFISLFGLFGVCQAEWSHYTERKGVTIFVGQKKSSNPKCKNLNEASEQKYSLGKWHYIRDLCYTLNSKGDPLFSDPDSINPFSNFTLKSEDFTYIPTKAEKELAANKERASRMIDSLNRARIELDSRTQYRHQQDGVTHMIINGEPVLCMRIGPMMDCN